MTEPTSSSEWNFFNILNHMNPGPYGTTLGATPNEFPNFGVVTTTQTDSREIQLAIKLLF